MAAVVLLMTAACGGSGPERDVNAITVWTLENLPERLAAQQAIAAEFSRATGVAVEVVGIDEDQFNQLVMSAAASGKLPDVVGALSLAGVRSLAANEL
ncbi:MAG: bicyclomycin resistance protein, partial [Gammaproteobacteria bacterium]